jgi:4-hydroxy-tetrahydrodipicolinate synthase
MIHGIIPAMVTPITEDQRINHSVTVQLARELLSKGAAGLFILGTNGEFHMLTTEEKVAFTKTVATEVDGAVPLIVGAGSNSTKEVIELSKVLKEAGADVLSIITPYFIQPTQDELIDHYRAIAKAVELPLLMYNIPKKTGVTLEPETVCELAREKNIVGIKDSSGQFELIENYIRVTAEEEFVVLAGTDSLILDTLEAGGTGAVAATANIVPNVVNNIYEYWKQGERDKARQAQEKLAPIRALFSKGTIPAVIKKALEVQGIKVGAPIHPIRDVSQEVEEQLRQVLSKYWQK